MHRPRRRKLALVAAAALSYTGSAALVRWNRRRRGDHRVYILAYHDVSASREPEGVVSAARFGKHVRFLKQHFDVVPLDEAVSMLAGTQPLRRDVAVITLDDGYLGNYEHAFPVLQAERVSATVFVTTGFLDGAPLWFDVARQCLANAARRNGTLPLALAHELRKTFGAWPPPPAVRDPGEVLKRVAPPLRDRLVADISRACGRVEQSTSPLQWDHVRHMAKAGVEIGCHTVNHPILSTLSADDQRHEIENARDRIAAEIGTPPRFFAYPNGSARDFTEDTVRELRAAGFRAACSTIRGANTPGGDPLRLKRIGVGADPRCLLEARFCGLFDESVRRRIGEAQASATAV